MGETSTKLGATVQKEKGCEMNHYYQRQVPSVWKLTTVKLETGNAVGLLSWSHLYKCQRKIHRISYGGLSLKLITFDHFRWHTNPNLSVNQNVVIMWTACPVCTSRGLPRLPTSSFNHRHWRHPIRIKSPAGKLQFHAFLPFLSVSQPVASHLFRRCLSLCKGAEQRVLTFGWGLPVWA